MVHKERSLVVCVYMYVCTYVCIYIYIYINVFSIAPAENLQYDTLTFFWIIGDLHPFLLDVFPINLYLLFQKITKC